MKAIVFLVLFVNIVLVGGVFYSKWMLTSKVMSTVFLQLFMLLINRFTFSGEFTVETYDQAAREVVFTDCPDELLLKSSITPFTLPDGTQIEAQQHFLEPFFKPGAVKAFSNNKRKNTTAMQYNNVMQSSPVQHCVADTIFSSPLDDCRKDLAQSILIAGGCSMFKGFSQRLLMPIYKLGLVVQSSPL